MTDGLMQGKTAIVTGGGRGMGEATAVAFAAAGAKVVVADLDGDAARGTAEAIVAAGGEAVSVQADVSVEDSVREVVAAAVERFGRLDCAVNNAAIKPDQAPIAEADAEHFDHVVAVNMRSVMLCDKHEIAQMLAQGDGGAIVNVASTSSVRVQPETVAYNAAKHGVIGITKTAALEVTGKGIRVNAVIPGAIDTPMLRTALDEINMTEADYAPVLSLFGRFGRPEEVAQASLWLCSDLASYTTGHALAVDGGYLAR